MSEARKLPEVMPVSIGDYPEFYRLLMTRLNEIVPREISARANFDEQVPGSPGDEADLSVLDTSADYFSNLANTHQKTIVEIRAAMDRMNRGVYGICEACEEEISRERLKQIPEARLCINCQSRLERTQTMLRHAGQANQISKL
jgi:DnaK suppressor protein